jgi:thioesterase domain-containing protein
VDSPVVGINQVLQDGEAEPATIAAMAARYADRLQTAYPAGPYKILGWSFGGVVAHALAVELRRRGCEVQRLVLLDPALRASLITAVAGGAHLDEGQILEHILRTNRIGIPPVDGPLTYERAEEILTREGEVQFPLPPKELVDLMVRSVNANQKYLRGHVPEVFDGDMTIFTATRSALTDNSGTALIARLHGLRLRMAARVKVHKWRRHVAGDLSAYPVDCTHHDMLNPISLRLYGEQLKRSLD